MIQCNTTILVFSDADWRTILADYRGGVDYPISFFYKEIYKAYPNAKVINCILGTIQCFLT